ncbi:MAG: hypothetical protein QM781_07965 [Chitinophagaceae bacterium]
MNPVYKLLFFFLIFLLTALAGYRIYMFFDRKIKSSRNGRGVVLYAVLLFVICALLLLISTLMLVYGYEWLKLTPDPAPDSVTL